MAAAPLSESSRPLGSSRGLLAAFGFTSPLSTELMELLGGGEGGFAFTEAFEPITGMLMLSSATTGDAAGPGTSAGGELGPGVGLGVAVGAAVGAAVVGAVVAAAAVGAGEPSRKSCLGGLALSSVSETGLTGLLAGEVKGVPKSVSLELSRWELSREMRLELPPLELRLSSAMLLFFLCTSSGGRY